MASNDSENINEESWAAQVDAELKKQQQHQPTHKPPASPMRSRLRSNTSTADEKDQPKDSGNVQKIKDLSVKDKHTVASGKENIPSDDLNAQIQQLNLKIKSMSDEIVKKDQEITQRDTVIKQKSQIIKDKNTVIQDKDGEINSKDTELKDTQGKLTKKISEVEAMAIQNAKLVAELSETKAAISVHEQQYSELVEKMASNQASCSETPVIKPQVLLITEKYKSSIGQSISNSKTDNITWDMLNRESISRLEAMMTDAGDSKFLKKYNLIIVCMGTEDIKNGIQVHKVFTHLEKVVNKMAKSFPTAVVSIPPLNLEGFMTDPSVLNYKIATMSGENIQVINVTVPLLDQMKLVKSDGYGGEVFGKAIIDNISIPDGKSDVDSNQTEDPDKIYIEVMETDNAKNGAIIGKDGEIVNAMAEDCNVSISVGSWNENRKKTPILNGALIEGTRANIAKAKRVISDKLSNYTPQNPPKRYKRNKPGQPRPGASNK